MSMLTVSSKGQVVLPAALRRRLGLGPGAELTLTEEADGLRLRVARAINATEVGALAGMIKAPPGERPRRLEDFDPAALVGRRGQEDR